MHLCSDELLAAAAALPFLTLWARRVKAWWGRA
jgi:hypothetical protein